MKPKITICAIISAFAILAVSGILLHRHFSVPAKKAEETEDYSASVFPQNTCDIKHPETSEVISKNPQIEKYILHMDKVSKKVFLTTRYADGSELISHIKAIDPAFLEAEDIKSLEEGITLSSKEDMFILIEDYSS